MTKPYRTDERIRESLPSGVRLLQTLRGHTDEIQSVAFGHDGLCLASGSADGTVKLWDVTTGQLIKSFEEHTGPVNCVAFGPKGEILASGSRDGTVKLRNVASGEMIGSLNQNNKVYSIAFFERVLAVGCYDGSVNLWETSTRQLFKAIKGRSRQVWSLAFGREGEWLACGNEDGTVAMRSTSNGCRLYSLSQNNVAVRSVVLDRKGLLLVSAGDDGTINLWDLEERRLLRSLEGHTDWIDVIAFTPDERLLVSKSNDGTIRAWDCVTWETVAVINEPASHDWWAPALTFHPTSPILAAGGSYPQAHRNDRDPVIHIYELNIDALLGNRAGQAVKYNTAKIVLVGDSGVGKTGLGWRLAHGSFKEHSSTHGQQFWLLDGLCDRSPDDVQYEAILWDLAGQHDYRIVHAIYLDDVDLALVLFDPTHHDDPLRGVEFWLNQLRSSRSPDVPILLVASRSDCGMPHLTADELEAYCKQREIAGYICTSAKLGAGINELTQRRYE